MNRRRIMKVETMRECEDCPGKYRKQGYLVLSLFIPVVGLILAIYGSFTATAALPASPQTEIQRLLGDAVGYAAVYNYQKTEELCDRVLTMTKDPQVQARAHWLKAVAYANFQLEYRTDSLTEKLKNETEMVRRLNPELLGDILARLGVSLEFHLPEEPNIDDIVNKARAAYGDRAMSDPTSVFKLACTYWLAAKRKRKTSREKSREYYARARKLFNRAMEMRPDNYEYAVYYLTLLGEMGLNKEAEEIGKRIIEKFDSTPRYAFESDPYCLYAAAVGLSDQAMGETKYYVSVQSRRAPMPGFTMKRCVIGCGERVRRQKRRASGQTSFAVWKKGK